jgi:predicted phosphodiesterase
MKLAITSDLHLEFEATDPEWFEAKADVLILAGDIATTRCRHFDEFMDKASASYNHVLYIIGNHEHYGNSFDKTADLFANKVKRFNNVYLLDNSIVMIDQYKFIGSTLWSNFHDNWHNMYIAKQYMSDFRGAIKYNGLDFNPVDSTNEHLKSVDFIKKEIDLHDDKCVVITHHTPSFKSCSDKYIGDSLNNAFHSELSYIMLNNDNIPLWVHGHTHDEMDYKISNTRVVCNPRGYPGELSHRKYSFKIVVI